MSKQEKELEKIRGLIEATESEIERLGAVLEAIRGETAKALGLEVVSEKEVGRLEKRQAETERDLSRSRGRLGVLQGQAAAAEKAVAKAELENAHQDAANLGRVASAKAQEIDRYVGQIQREISACYDRIEEAHEARAKMAYYAEILQERLLEVEEPSQPQIELILGAASILKERRAGLAYLSPKTGSEWRQKLEQLQEARKPGTAAAS